MNILVAVRNNQDASLLRSYLRRLGCRVFEAENVEALCSIYAAIKAPLIILDPSMYFAARDVLVSIRSCMGNQEYLSILLLDNKGEAFQVGQPFQQWVDRLDTPCNHMATQNRIALAVKCARIFDDMVVAMKHAAMGRDYGASEGRG